MPSAQYFEALPNALFIQPLSRISVKFYENVISYLIFSKEKLRLRRTLSENVCFLHKHEELNLISSIHISKTNKEKLHMTMIPVIGMVVAEIGGLLSNQCCQNTLNLTFNERFSFKTIR